LWAGGAAFAADDLFDFFAVGVCGCCCYGLVGGGERDEGVGFGGFVGEIYGGCRFYGRRRLYFGHGGLLDGCAGGREVGGDDVEARGLATTSSCKDYST
jgi:hypothetical protein